MLKKIFLPWLVIAELENKLRWAKNEEEYYKAVIDQLMKERASLRPKRDKNGRFSK